ncbi:antitoxin [uncultured Desulfuromonas sp.]|uniref:antitoxin n=1 Tax=uncultured Desulfuromonas sp. TaxID=181013 RepID=UPI002AAC4BFB|nr:antitoxin [uncultured Desulfuromonas sp.]
MDNEELYRQTMALWGEQAQYDQAVEECAELCAALMHYRREKVAPQQVIDELADVTLMIGQLTWMFGADRVGEAVERKRAKLEQLMAKESSKKG